MSTRKLTLQIDRARHAESRMHDSALPALAPEQVRLRIERFAITANTVTYATTGDVLGYWDFFPTGVPAMGWAEVVESLYRGREVHAGRIPPDVGRVVSLWD